MSHTPTGLPHITAALVSVVPSDERSEWATAPVTEFEN